MQRDAAGRLDTEGMTTIQILLRVTKDVGTDTDDAPGVGHRFVFTNDLALERYDDSTPGDGLPVNVAQRQAGAHTGVLTAVRVAGANDDFFRMAVSSSNTRPHISSTPSTTLLAEGAVTARGVLLLIPTTTSWSHQLGLRSLVARGPTPQLMERSRRGSQSPKADCSISSCKSNATRREY
jgi:hypothetical protein